MFGLFDFFPSTKKYDWDELKKKGTVTEDKVTDKKTGLTTITRTFTSSTGIFNIESTETYYTGTDIDNKYSELKSKLQEAIDNEQFEDAITYRDAITELKKQITNKN